MARLVLPFNILDVLPSFVTHSSSLQVHPCPASCVVIGAFPATDSGAYWCETGAGQTSQTVNITVTGTTTLVLRVKL